VTPTPAVVALVLAVAASSLVAPAGAQDCTTECHVDAVSGDDAANHGTAPGDAWKGNKIGYVYKDREQTPDGISNLTLRAGRARKGRIIVQAQGPRARVPVLPLALPVRVQLVVADGPVCWDAVFSQAKKNQGALLKATSDR
jgi:hypothetical protein